MGLRGRIRRLEKTMRGRLSFFELADGQTYYFDPQETFSSTFLFFADSMDADAKRTPRPEPPELLKAVAQAKDRGEALARVMGGNNHLPVDQEALVERGEFVHRSLLVGHEYGEDGVLRPTQRGEAV